MTKKIVSLIFAIILISFAVLVVESYATSYNSSTPRLTNIENLDGSVKLSWNSVSGVYKYRVYYKGRNGWTRFVETTGNTAYDDVVKSGETYTYTIRGLDRNNNFVTDYSATGWRHTYVAVPQMNNIENLDNAVKLTWNYVPGAYKYRAYYRGRNGWTRFAETTGNTAVDDVVKSGETYTYTIRALDRYDNFVSYFNTDGWRYTYYDVPEFSNIENLDGSVKLSWNAVPGVYKYRVYYKDKKGWTRFTETTDTTAYDTNVTPGGIYIYTIRGLDSNDNFVTYFNTDGWNHKYVFKKQKESIADSMTKTGSFAIPTTQRAFAVYSNYLFHSGTSKSSKSEAYGIEKLDISDLSNITSSGRAGGHRLTNLSGRRYALYPRNIAYHNGYVYAPYRDNASGIFSNAVEDVGGYLDIINADTMTLEKTLTFEKEILTDDDFKDVLTYKADLNMCFGKCNYVATYDNYLCLTMQMGGWMIYDISNPSNPTLKYRYDNRYDCYMDNHNTKVNNNKGKGFADFHQCVFYEDNNGELLLAIAGYDRDLVTIYKMSDVEAQFDKGTQSNIKPVFSYNIRLLANQTEGESIDKLLTSQYLHSMGIAVNYPYIYCTVAPYPGKLGDSHGWSGIACINVADINNASVSVEKIPENDMFTSDSGELAPTSIAIDNNMLYTDGLDKGVYAFSIENGILSYRGRLDTNTDVCGLLSYRGNLFVGSTYDSDMLVYSNKEK